MASIFFRLQNLFFCQYHSDYVGSDDICPLTNQLFDSTGRYMDNNCMPMFNLSPSSPIPSNRLKKKEVGLMADSNKVSNLNSIDLSSPDIPTSVSLLKQRYPRPHWAHTNPRQFWAKARLLKHAARGRNPRTSRMRPPGFELGFTTM
ncbi:hypothetical protein OSB04_021362 [Centaurea solstitialis]|uniref:Uncharacterized protein n=1 Tax=Centaurea solstitialis TaxID=347529 RepID=A0AA38SU20_9ASTR|nr:hypothetical protein OSB04_021362 [Centaurea solstitialis]